MIEDKEEMKTEARIWCLCMFGAAILALFTGFSQKFSFGIVGENITLNMRHRLYSSILKKNIGWFDARENSSGVLTSVLASDIQTLNGASTEGAAVIVEEIFALSCGIILGFCYSWKVSLVALACTPLMAFGGSINAKFQAGMSKIDDENYKDANLLAGDAIMNYRTVASFAHDELIVKQYDIYLEGPVKRFLKLAHCIGLAFGFSQAIQYWVFGVLYYAGAKFAYNDPNTTGEDVFNAIFAMMFGAFAAG
jgi:ATP-binding cassette subfamily B (MDR/TAP) protein 1